jgi:SAM-dependent methyltransferase
LSEALKERVRAFWEADPCGTRHLDLAGGERKFFADLERERDRREPFIASFARFDEHPGKRILEVGIGPGTDLVQFARAGAIATGIDLTQRGVDLTRRRLDLEGLEAQLFRADAEELPFNDGAFDFVYSWGVIHHTPNPPQAARELVRVTKPGGRICVMVYHRHSLVALQSWFVHGLARGQPWRSLADLISSYHESPGTRAYTIAEAGHLFEGVVDLVVTPVVTPFDVRISRTRSLPVSIRRLIPCRLGWFLVIEAEKPAGRRSVA